MALDAEQLRLHGPARKQRSGYAKGKANERLKHGTADHHAQDVAPVSAQCQRTPISGTRCATEYAVTPYRPMEASSSASRPKAAVRRATMRSSFVAGDVVGGAAVLAAVVLRVSPKGFARA